MTTLFIINVIATISSVILVGTYLLWPGRIFHLANALCGPSIIVSELVVGAWPALLITTAFTVFGTINFWRERGPSELETLQVWEKRVRSFAPVACGAADKMGERDG
jgi:hypothetical protein